MVLVNNNKPITNEHNATEYFYRDFQINTRQHRNSDNLHTNPWNQCA